MSDVVVDPPTLTAWWDVASTAAAVLARLRLSTDDLDEARIKSLVPAAGVLIDQYIDSTTAIAAAPALTDAIVEVTAAMYRDEPDPFGSVRAQLEPFRRRWGVA